MSVCGSQRDKEKSLRCRRVKCLIYSKRAEQGTISLLGSQFVYMGVFSNDFATVDVREVLCYHSRPKKHKFKRQLAGFKGAKIYGIFYLFCTLACTLTLRNFTRFCLKIMLK